MFYRSFLPCTFSAVSRKQSDVSEQRTEEEEEEEEWKIIIIMGLVREAKM